MSFQKIKTVEFRCDGSFFNKTTNSYIYCDVSEYRDPMHTYSKDGHPTEPAVLTLTGTSDSIEHQYFEAGWTVPTRRDALDKRADHYCPREHD